MWQHKDRTAQNAKKCARRYRHSQFGLPVTLLHHLPKTIGQAPAVLGRALIKIYRYTLSPIIGFHCRHLPTCSEYSDEAVRRHGLWAGGWMTLARLSRCHPWGTSGLDFVPQSMPQEARWYLPWRYGRWTGVNTIPADRVAG